MKIAFFPAAMSVLAGVWPVCGQEPKVVGRPVENLLFDGELWETPLTEIRGGDAPLSEEEKQWRAKMAAEGKMMRVKRKEGFDWMSADKRALVASAGQFTLWGGRTGEITVRGSGDAPDEVSVSLYNRGDDGEVSPEKFATIFEEWKKRLDGKLQTRAEERDGGGAIPVRGWMWRAGKSAVLLEGSVNRAEKRPEFLRIRLAPLAASRQPERRARRASYAGNVKEDESGFTYIPGIPMVDQGQKGYCVVATVERVGRYFGRSVDQHEMAQLAGTGTTSEGTSIEGMEKAFQRVTGRIHLRTIKHFGIEPRQLERDIKEYNRAAEKAGAKTFPYDPKTEQLNPLAFWQSADGEVFRRVKREQSAFSRFEGKIKDYVDQGIPLCWSLFLGMFPEPGLPQVGGGHMRIIYGYNFHSKDPAERKILYTDSWGRGHERKEMRADEAFAMTTGLYSMIPTS